MSIGAVTQHIDFLENDFTLILGTNLDKSGEGHRNGTGKSTLIQAFCFALFGEPITSIRIDNLINKKNKKNLVVSLEYEVNGVLYRVERGRKPNFLRCYKNNDLLNLAESETRGESSETQKYIEDTLGISFLLFKQIFLLMPETYVTSFPYLRKEQNVIIEELLGLRRLGIRSSLLKDQIKITKDKLKEEQLKLEIFRNNNKKLQEHITEIMRKSQMWVLDKNSQQQKITKSLQTLLQLDIEQELQKHKDNDFLKKCKQTYKNYKTEVDSVKSQVDRLVKTFDQNTRHIEILKQKKCPECNQNIDHNHDDLLKKYVEQNQSIIQQITDLKQQYTDKKSKLDSLLSYSEKDFEITFYEKIENVYEHKNTLEKLQLQLSAIENSNNPYEDQIQSLRDKAVVKIDTKIENDLKYQLEHEEFVYKMLTKQDSPLRKIILDKNLKLLNTRLKFYLDKLEFSHSVNFSNNLDLNIMLYGESYDFDQLSEGERKKTSLAIRWAFRDIWESQNQEVNLCFVDELFDSAIDLNGLETSWSYLKKLSGEQNKNVFLITHKDELIARVNNVILVRKENNYTSLERGGSDLIQQATI